MTAWTDLLNTVIYPTLALVLTGVVTLGLAWVAKALGVSASAAQDLAAHGAVTGAVATFAGKVVGDIAAGKLTLVNVRHGVQGEAVAKYAADTVKESLDRLGVTPATLSTMLIGKVDTLLVPATGRGEPKGP